MDIKLTKKQKKLLRRIGLVFAAFCLVVELIGYIPGVAFNGWKDVGVMLGLTPNYVTAEGELEVHFIDVGNADCILVRQQDKTLLIDAGDVAKEEIIRTYLTNHGVKHLDLIIVTHPHADHIGSMYEVLKDVTVGQFIMAYMPEGKTPTTISYTKMLKELNKKSIKITEAVPGDIYELGTARVQLLSPLEETEDVNNMSIVTRVTFGDKAFLFAGDAEKEVESQLLKSGYALSADVIKLGHHGSNTSSSSAFLKRVNPQIAIITCGVDNAYGHPHDEIIRRLDTLGIEYYRADMHGNMVVTTDGEKITVDLQRG